jgi:hypothetical protein
VARPCAEALVERAVSTFNAKDASDSMSRTELDGLAWFR